MSGALAEALVAAQRRAMQAVEKAYVAGALERDEAETELILVGATDAVDRCKLLDALDALRKYGAPLPSEPVSQSTGATETPRGPLGDDATWLSGKHKGQTLAATPADYLEWYAANGPDPVARSASRGELERRGAAVDKAPF